VLARDDATGRWATQWLTWDRFARFWALAAVRAEGLSRLFEAKTRTGKVRSALLEPAAERTEHGHPGNTGRDTAPPTPAPATPVTKTPPDTTATGEDGTLARKLLKKKRG
jgi:hypothetical protein